MLVSIFYVRYKSHLKKLGEIAKVDLADLEQLANSDLAHLLTRT